MKVILFVCWSMFSAATQQQLITAKDFDKFHYTNKYELNSLKECVDKAHELAKLPPPPQANGMQIEYVHCDFNSPGKHLEMTYEGEALDYDNEHGLTE